MCSLTARAEDQRAPSLFSAAAGLLGAVQRTLGAWCSPLLVCEFVLAELLRAAAAQGAQLGSVLLPAGLCRVLSRQLRDAMGTEGR